jgi:hypothetical protein
VADQRRSITLQIGWVLLAILGLALTAGGAASLATAYRGSETFAGVPLDRFSELDPDLPNVLRARRATAAFYALSCGLLLGWVATNAFRRGEKWAWWAVLTSLGFGCAGSLLRLPLLGVRAGTETAGAILVVAVVALAISYRDFK